MITSVRDGSLLEENHCREGMNYYVTLQWPDPVVLEQLYVKPNSEHLTSCNMPLFFCQVCLEWSWGVWGLQSQSSIGDPQSTSRLQTISCLNGELW